MLIDLQIMDNEAIAEYKHIITLEWGVKYQLVPAHIHRRNAAKRAIYTFKAHFPPFWQEWPQTSHSTYGTYYCRRPS